MEVIHGLDLTVKSGSFTVFVGPSGCGKSTLLRMIAGLEDVTAGRDPTRRPALRASFAVEPRHGDGVSVLCALSAHERAREPALRPRLPEGSRRRRSSTRIARAADILQITHLLDRQPSQLSGGQSQRVAIGRAIVKEPKAFLFDEPLSNLDAELRVKMRSEIAALHRRLGSTMIYVTHDQVEAMTMADTIVVLRDGMVEQIGSPIELYTRPRNRFVASFLGAPQMNMLAASAVSGDGPTLDLAVDQGRVRVEALVTRRPAAPHSPLTLGVRPEHLTLTDDGRLRARVEASEILGAETIIYGVLESGERLAVSLRGPRRVGVGEEVGFALDPKEIHLFDADGVALR